MPRFARVVVPQCPHHVTQRGNARRDIFFTDTDRHVYLGLLQQYSALYGVDVLGYCLMSNHVHLILIPHVDTALSKLMREVNMRYSQFRNAVERTNGHLWQSRYYSCPVDPGRLAIVMRYVELNPVRAGMVAAPERYRWSSAGAHASADRRAAGVNLLAFTDWDLCWTADEWAAILQAGGDAATEIRAATYGGRPLGSSEFVAELERLLGRRLTPGKPGRPPKLGNQHMSAIN